MRDAKNWGFRPGESLIERLEEARVALAIETEQIGRGVSNQELLSRLLNEALDARDIGLPAELEEVEEVEVEVG